MTILTWTAAQQHLNSAALPDPPVGTSCQQDSDSIGHPAQVRVHHGRPHVLAEFRRVMRPAGPLLVGFHVGDEARHTAEGYSGRSINVDSYRRPPAKVARWLREVGFAIEAELVMRPDEEAPGGIILARSPG
jgi:hypothetical protein